MILCLLWIVKDIYEQLIKTTNIIVYLFIVICIVASLHIHPIVTFDFSVRVKI